MPIPRQVARLNRRLTNPVLGTAFGRLPPFAIIVHQGRRSAREYRTPVWAFRADDGYVVALTYSADSDWVKNVLAAGGCILERRGRRVEVSHARVVGDKDAQPWIPAALQPVLGFLGIDRFLVLTTVA